MSVDNGPDEDDFSKQRQAKKEARVRLELFASKLKNVAGAFRGTSDPYAICTLLADKPGDKPRILGKTEVVKNSLSPHWTTHFDLQFTLGKQTRVNVGVYDEENRRNNKDNGNDRPMGSALFEIGEILGSRGNIKAKKLRHGGTLFCRVTPVPLDAVSTGQRLTLHLRGVECKPTGRIAHGKPSPFLEISSQVKAASGLSWQALYRSEPIMNSADPTWPAIVFDLERLQANYSDITTGDGTRAKNESWHTPLRIQVWDWQKSGKHRSLGRVETTVAALQRIQQQSTSIKKINDNNDNDVLYMARTMELFVKEKSMGRLVVEKVRIEKAEKKTLSCPAEESSRRKIGQRQNNQQSSKHSAPTDFSAMSTLQGSLPSLAIPSTASPLSQDTYNPAKMPYIPSPPTRQPSILPPPEAALGYDDLPPAMAPPPQRPQFIDYISGGCELELCIAIDFTGSNGDPRKPGSLHCLHPIDSQELNDYEKALTAVGGIIAKYDTDQKFPVWGFGAKYNGVIQHCFRIGDADELDGINGVLAAYQNIFRTGLTMSGPTVFEEVINLAAAKARSQHEMAMTYGSQSYRVLLILTDGAVTDVESAKRSIQAASDTPLSIVIVGIGDADFSEMRFLDDFQTEIGGGRDICQFVEFRKVQHDKSALTKQTLEEIPDQMVDFFYSRGIMPMPPRRISQTSMSNISVEDPNDHDIDLDVGLDERGEPYLTNYNGCVFDDTRYSISSPSPLNDSSVHAQLPSSSSSYQRSPEGIQLNPLSSATSPKSDSTGADHPTPSIFYVQVPMGVSAGTHLRIRHPITQEELIVMVPPGVAPGGKFGVRY